jgi:hypothetical protein
MANEKSLKFESMQRTKEWLNCEKYGEPAGHYEQLIRFGERNSSFDLSFLFLALPPEAAQMRKTKQQAAVVMKSHGLSALRFTAVFYT